MTAGCVGRRSARRLAELRGRLVTVLSALSVPAGNIRGPQYMDQALAALHQGNRQRSSLTLCILQHNDAVTLACHYPDDLQGLLTSQLYAQYPDVRITPLQGDAPIAPAGTQVCTALSISPELFPIKRYSQFEDALNRCMADPIAAILTAMKSDDPALRASIEIIVRPGRKRRVKRLRRCLHRLARPFFRRHPRLAHRYVHLAFSPAWTARACGFLLGRLARPGDHPETKALDMSGSRQHDREEDLQAASDKAGKSLFETQIHICVSAPPAAKRAATRKLLELAATFGQFNAPRLASFHSGAIREQRKKALREPTFLLSAEELATLWHPPTATVHAEALATVESREAEPPLQLPTPERHEGLAILGTIAFRSREQRFGIFPDDRRRHVYIAGKTGMGKSTLLLHLISSDIAAGRGAGLIDPHGDLVEAVLSTIPPRRTNDIVLFDAGDRDFPLAFNVLACAHPDQRPLVASGIIGAFKKIWGDAIGPRSEDILRNALLALLEVPGTTLLSVVRILTEERFREAVLRQVNDPLVLAFWKSKFAGWHPRFQSEAVAPILNKLGAFTSSPLIRNIVGQPRSTIDLRKIMDEGKVLLINMSKGRIGEDAAALLGSFLVTGLQLAAMSRADQAESERRDFYLYVDEFQNYATDSFATILSEARKYRLSLTVANQYLAQVEEQTLDAVFGNVGTLICFAVGVQDAEILAAQLNGDLTAKDLLALPRYQAYARLLINGVPSRPFSLRTLPPPNTLDQVRPHVIRRYSRHRYGRPAPQVEQAIERAFAMV